MRRSIVALGRRRVRKNVVEEAVVRPQVEARSAAHASSATTRIREEVR